MAWLQVTRQHLAARKMNIPQSGERVLVVLSDCRRQRLRRDFENAPENEKNEKRFDDVEVESQLAGYFAMVSGRSKCHSGFVKAHTAVFLRSIRAG